MATTGYLYHTLGLTHYHHERTEFRRVPSITMSTRRKTHDVAPIVVPC